MNTINIKKLKPVELTADEISVHLQTHEGELDFLTDRINTQLEMIENLQEKLEAVEHELTDHRFNKRVFDKMLDMVHEGHFKLLTDFYISDQ